MGIVSIDIESGAGVKQGAGPITSAASWRYTARMDKAGTFDFEMPASDSKAQLVRKKYVARAYALLNNARVEVGAGIIDSIEKRVAENGQVMLHVSGDDLIRELTYRSVLDLKLYAGGNPVSHAAAVSAVAGYAPIGWALTADGSPPNNSIYGYFNGETVLQGAIKIAEKSQNHFYRGVGRSLIFASSYAASGMRAIRANGELAANTCAIRTLSEQISSYEYLTRIYPRGSGNAEVQITLHATTRTAPPGYVLDKSANYIEYATGVSNYGLIEQQVDFRDIGPVANTDADIIAASNALFDAALERLKRQSSELEQATYRIGVAGCSTLLHPMQTLRIVYRDSASGLNIDAEQNILETTWQADASGVQTTDLVVSNADRWPASDAGTVVDAIANGKVYQALPQPNSNSYVTAYNKLVDPNYSATFRFRFGSEVTQLQQVLFEFQILPLESSVKSVGSSSGGSGDIPISPPNSNTTGGGGNNDSGVGGPTESGSTTSTIGAVTPAIGSETPAIGSETPAIGSETPAIGSTSGTSGAATPIVGSSTPDIGTATATIGSATPTIGSETPVIGNATPTIGSESPAIASATPTIGSESPVIGNATPTIGSTTATIGSTTLTTSADAGTTDLVTPLIGSETPTVGSATPAIGSTALTSATATPNIGQGGTASTQGSGLLETQISLNLTADPVTPTIGGSTPTLGTVTPTIGSTAQSTDLTSLITASRTLDTGNPTGGDIVSAGQHGHGVVVFSGTGNQGSVQLHDLGGGNFELRNNNIGGAVQPNSATLGGNHTHPVNSHDHSISAHTHTIAGHGHTISAHTHTITAHTHTIASHTHTMSSHTHDITSHAHTIATHSHNIAAHDHTLDPHSHTIASHAHTIAAHSHTIAAHTHTITAHSHGISAHTHTITAHTHTQAVHAHTITAHSHTADAHTHSITAHSHTQSLHAHTMTAHSHTADAHTHTLPSHSHTVSTHDHTIASHTHTIAAHTHTIAAHTHTIAAHSHTIAAHTHTIASHSHTITSHTHSMSSHTHSLSSHTHSLNNHTHSLSGSITAVYGIFRASLAETYVLSDLDYRVNGGAWIDIETVAVDAGDGWWQLDITAAVINANTLRPAQSNNLLEIRSLTAAKAAQLDVQLSVRNSIQAIAYV